MRQLNNIENEVVKSIASCLPYTYDTVKTVFLFFNSFDSTITFLTNTIQLATNPLYLIEIIKNSK